MLAKDRRLGRPSPQIGLKALTKHAHTIDDLLTHSDVNEVLENVVKQKADIDEIVIIYKSHKDEEIRWCANDLEAKSCLWMLEIVKQNLLNDDDDDE